MPAPSPTPRSNPNDPRYAGNPDYSYRDGRWYFKNSATPLPVTNDLPWKDETGTLIDPTTGQPVDPAKAESLNQQASGAPPAPGQTDQRAVGFADIGGWLNKLMTGKDPTYGVPAGSPGSSLETSAADEDRSRLQSLLTQLQGQAQTGSGAWEQQLANDTQGANATAMALAQSQPGLDPMSSLRSVGNATAANTQKSAGQAELLREQTKQNAQSQLADIYAGQGSLDANQAAADAGVKQGLRETSNLMTDNANRINTGINNGLLQGAETVGSFFSDGGKVPGQPEVFGDSEVNDTVPAKLSPGEIVIPRSIATRPDAAQQAAAFVQAVKSRDNAPKTNFDDGGSVEEITNDPSVIGANNPFAIPYQSGNASQANGALLNTDNYNATRDAALQNADAQMTTYQGAGPSVAPQAMRNATDTTIGDALRSIANSRGAGRAAGVGDTVMAGAQSAQEAAGNAAGIKAGESQRAASAFANAVTGQRAADLALAKAKQQAAWRNTQMNLGIGLEQQNQLRNLLAGAGQAAAVGADLFSNIGEGEDYDFDTDTGDSSSYDTSAIDEAFDADPSEAGDYDFNIDEGGYAAKGGVVRGKEAKRAAAFVKALQRREGGESRA